MCNNLFLLSSQPYLRYLQRKFDRPHIRFHGSKKRNYRLHKGHLSPCCPTPHMHRINKAKRAYPL